MAKSFPYKNHYALTTFFFIFLFLFSIFLFNKHNLEPSLFPYRAFLSYISSTDSTSPPGSEEELNVVQNSPTNDLPLEDNSENFNVVEKSPTDGLSVDRRGNPDATVENGGGNPVTTEENRLSVDDRGNQDATEENKLSVDGRGNPVAPQENGAGNPVATEENELTVDGRGNPDATEDNRPSVDGRGNPVATEENGDSVDGRGNPIATEENSGAAGDSVGHSSVEAMKECDLYTGTWVKDEEYPIYKPGSCPYVDEAFICQRNGRPDSGYLKWRWKPDGCHLPRFNATDFLERIRGKRLMLIGDSMNRNQFESILCLLHQGLLNKSKMYEIHGHKISKGRGYFVFKFEDYGCTVEFVRSHYLVKEGVRINGQGNSNPTLSIDRIDKTSGRWKRADILVFNTGHWWTHGKTARGKNYYKEGDYLYPKLDSTEAYRRALQTWSKWIDQNIKPAKQLVFYRGYSSAHFRGGDWDSGGSCSGETEPILSGTYLDTYPMKMKIVEEVIRGMEVPVILLNVTRLTNFRKDGHPSIYGKNVAEGKKVSLRRQDCSHWCLPGVPDAWNELIYATLVFHQSFPKTKT